MESFFRYISYVDYYKREERIKNVGFLRWKLSHGEHNIELQIKGIFGQQGTFDIRELNTGKRIGEIKIDKGIGSFIKKFKSATASDEMYFDTYDGRLYMGDVEGLEIKLHSNEYLCVPIKFDKKEKENRSCGLDKIITSSEDSLSHKKITKNLEAKAASEHVLIDGIEEKYEEPKCIKKRDVEKEYKDEKVHISDNEWSVSKKIKVIEPIHENKWQQLCKDYPNIHPFPDKKRFLSIKPEDFIILQQEYQKLVQNSFLLHGFYNYGHMILGKLSEEEEAPVYVGVPGVYYEREKQAARMFGFIGFESTVHPVQEGSYGYYMIEVKI